MIFDSYEEEIEDVDPEHMRGILRSSQWSPAPAIRAESENKPVHLRYTQDEGKVYYEAVFGQQSYDNFIGRWKQMLTRSESIRVRGKVDKNNESWKKIRNERLE